METQNNQTKRKGRPAEITFSQYSRDGAKAITTNATFHCWGIRLKNAPDQPKVSLNETVGICELDSGEVRLVKPEKIMFKDR